MKRENKENIQEEVEVSQSMINDIKKDIQKFPTYDDFLYAVDAMRKIGNTLIVNKFKNEHIKNYETNYIDKYKHGIGDAFVFEKYATYMKSKSTSGKSEFYNTGYFIPRMFFDFILKEKYQE